MASTQDEFAEALRNVHLSAKDEVYVSARLEANGGAVDVTRFLVRDYGKKDGCASKILIGGKDADQAALEALGLRLSQPPLRAPVLAQHTLAYIFSVQPQDRATYFKAVLEVADLDVLRAGIAALSNPHLTPPTTPILERADRCLEHATLKPVLTRLQTKTPDLATFKTALSDAAKVLIESAGGTAPAKLHERTGMLTAMLEEVRSRTFPVAGFKRADLPAWVNPRAEIWQTLERFEEERGTVDAETQRLIKLSRRRWPSRR